MRVVRLVMLLGLGAFISAGFVLPAAQAADPANAPADDRPVLLTLVVPPNAEVWIDGKKTTMSGTVRQFVSPALKSGKNYLYTLRVHWQRNNKDVEETRSLTVQAGDAVRLDYLGQGAGYTMTPALSTGERSFYYTPEDELRRLTPSYYRPSAPYYSAPRSRYLDFYGNSPGVGYPDSTW